MKHAKEENNYYKTNVSERNIWRRYPNKYDPVTIWWDRRDWMKRKESSHVPDLCGIAEKWIDFAQNEFFDGFYEVWLMKISLHWLTSKQDQTVLRFKIRSSKIKSKTDFRSNWFKINTNSNYFKIKVRSNQDQTELRSKLDQISFKFIKIIKQPDRKPQLTSHHKCLVPLAAWEDEKDNCLRFCRCRRKTVKILPFFVSLKEKKPFY